MISTDYEESGSGRARARRSSLASNTADTFRFFGGCAQPWYGCRKETAVYRGGLDRGVSGLFLQDFCCSSLAFEGYTSLSMMAIGCALAEGVDMIP